nr:hypothetical protein [uncultured Flavobacterium sp.]
MRPFIDLSNLDFNGDTLIYYSRLYILSSIVVLFALIIGSIYFLFIENGFIFSILLWFIVLFYGQKIFYRLQRANEIQFRINSKGIQFRNEDFITWDNIENARVISENVGDDDKAYYFRYYISSENREIRTEIEPLNISSNELALAIRVFTEKFNIEKNKI